MTRTTPTKAEIQKWIRRVRMDLRDIETCMRENDGDGAITFGEDLSGAGAQVWQLLEDRYGPEGERS